MEAKIITCDVCGYDTKKGRRMNCVTCARSALLDPRLRLATALLDKEEKAKRVEAVVTGNLSIDLQTEVIDGAVVNTRDCVKTLSFQQTQVKITRLKETSQLLHDQETRVRAQLADYRKQIQEMKAVIARHKSDRESAGFELASRTNAEVDSIQKNTRKMVRKWDIRYQDFVRGRISLCREAARLARLQSQKIVVGQAMKQKFTIANGLLIPDLRDMNNVNPAELTASLSQVAYLVSRVATYLALRLPAEIVLPRPDQSHPMIFYPGPAFSYNTTGNTSANASHTTLSSASHSTARPSRGRVLHTMVPLAKLVKENRTALFMFVEGVTLLAWDIAWLCRTQGMQGLNTWTEVCAIGRNLHQLLLSDHRASIRHQREATDHATDPESSGTAHASKNFSQNYPSRFGQLSHGTAHSFLGTNEGSSILKDWKLNHPRNLMDKIKKHLVTEIQGAEWEVIQDRGWGQDGSSILHDGEEPVVVRQRKFSSNQGKPDSESVAGGELAWIKRK